MAIETEAHINRSFPRTRCGLGGVALALAMACAGAQGQPDSQHALTGASLAAALRDGGFVIYFRHADTGPAVPEPPGFDLARCGTQRLACRAPT
jgi:hypothetical protein